MDILDDYEITVDDGNTCGDRNFVQLSKDDELIEIECVLQGSIVKCFNEGTNDIIYYCETKTV